MGGDAFKDVIENAQGKINQARDLTLRCSVSCCLVYEPNPLDSLHFSGQVDRTNRGYVLW